MLDTKEIVKSILKSGMVFSLDNYELRLAFAGFMSDCVEATLYEILDNEGVIALSLDEFHEYVLSSEGIKAAARQVMIQAVDNFDRVSDFNFIDAVLEQPDDSEYGDGDGYDDEGERVSRRSDFLPDDEAVGLVDRFFFNAEVMFYLFQLKSGKTYAWEEFLAELAANRNMWDKLFLAFDDALMRIDYAPYWHNFLDGILDKYTSEDDTK